jgi:hypothetical protein
MFLSMSGSDSLTAGGNAARRIGVTSQMGYPAADMNEPANFSAYDLATAGVSPSIGSSHGAFETKFVVDDAVARSIQAWAREHLQVDPHAGANLADGYFVNSVYLDTPNFDTFRRSPFFRRRKFRLRRYGDEATIWLEVKRKRNGQVRKRRVAVTEADLAARLGNAPDPGWHGAWFQRRLEKRQLRPVCQVTYRRSAWIGTSATGPIRLTIDGDLSALHAAEWQVPSAPLPSEPLLRGRRIVEFKFREAMSAGFRGLIHDFRLEPAAFSKYRESVTACVPLVQLAGDEPVRENQRLTSLADPAAITSKE